MNEALPINYLTSTLLNVRGHQKSKRLISSRSCENPKAELELSAVSLFATVAVLFCDKFPLCHPS